MSKSKKAPSKQSKENSEKQDEPDSRINTEQIDPLQDIPEMIKEETYDIVTNTFAQRNMPTAIFNSYDESLVVDPDGPLKLLMGKMKQKLQDVEIPAADKEILKNGLLLKEKKAFASRFIEKKREDDSVQAYYNKILKNDELLAETSIMIRYNFTNKN